MGPRPGGGGWEGRRAGWAPQGPSVWGPWYHRSCSYWRSDVGTYLSWETCVCRHFTCTSCRRWAELVKNSATC